VPDVGKAGSTLAAAEVVATAQRTLAAPSARVAFHQSWNVPKLEAPRRRRRGGLLRVLLWPIKLAFRMAWRRAIGGRRFGALSAKGILEPATGRHMIDYGSYAEIYKDGDRFGGRSGRPVKTLEPWPPGEKDTEMLWLLRLALGVVDASEEADQDLHGTSCKKLAVRIDFEKALAATNAHLPSPAVDRFELLHALPATVWIDPEHVRRIEFTDLGSRHLVLELWDFGLDTAEYDWSRLPTFRSPSEAAYYSGEHQSIYQRAKRGPRAPSRS
jgi:hypothetical protein